MLNILIVDDSKVFRTSIEGAILQIEGLQVIGSVWSGEKAIAFLAEQTPDIILLDLSMPEMSGLETLRKIEEAKQNQGFTTQVLLMSSDHDRESNDIDEALKSGAFDFICKPKNTNEDQNMTDLKEQLLQKLNSMSPSIQTKAESTIPETAQSSCHGDAAIDQKKSDVELIAIGISTGGPKALQFLLPRLCKKTHLPIVIVQHMPKEFMESLTESLHKDCDHEVKLGTHGELLKDNTIYIAPGDHHMKIESSNGSCVIILSDQEKVNGFRPSADVLFKSVAKIKKNKCLGIIMTGMGNDGTLGLTEIKRQGGLVLAQDEASSVVWGMPGSAIQAGIVDRQVSLSEMDSAVLELCRGNIL